MSKQQLELTSAGLYLRGLNYGLELVKEDRYCIYHNKEHNVTILAIPYWKSESVEDVFNHISEDRFFPLIKFMNKNDNLIIKWTKVLGTTSDYTIYCDTDYLNYCNDWNIIDMEEYLWDLNSGKSNSYKYNIVKYGKTMRFKFPFTIRCGIRYDHPDGNIKVPLETHYKGTPVDDDWWIEYIKEE